MRIKAGTLGVDITADGHVLETTLKRADSLTESFATNVDRRMKRASASFQGVGQAAGLTDKEMAALEKRMRDGMAADTATRALDNLRKYAGLTAQEYSNLAAKMGVATRESDKASLSLAGLAKRAGAVAAAYLSVREGARAAGDAFMAFVGYEAALTDMARVTTDSLEGVDATIKALPRSMGDPTAMMQAYYQVLSSGATDSAQAMDLLTTSAKGSKAAHVGQAETVKGLTKLLAGFDGEIRSAAEASDLLFRIDNLGQTSFAELVPVIGDVAEVTHLVGVSSQEMAAGLALVTQTSGSTSEAATKWKAIMVGLYKPTENMEKVLKALGYESGEAMVQQLGFAGTLQKLEAVAEKSGFSMGKLFESSEALTGIAGLGAQEWERYAGMLDGVRKGSDETEQAWRRWLGTSQAVKDAYDATLKQMAIEFGGELAPMMTAGMQTFADTVVANKGPIITTLGGIEMSVQAITAVVMAATREYQKFANSIAAGIAVVNGEMAFGDWALSGPEELAKKLQAAGDKVRAEADKQAKEAKTQALMVGDNAGAIPELADMFPGDMAPKVEKVKKRVEGITVALKDNKKGAEAAALAAERYGERASSYFDQVESAIAGLSDSLSGGLEGETLKVDKTFQRIFADIRKNIIGAKGDTSDLAAAWVLAWNAWPVARMTAELKDYEKELDKAAKYARDMGTYLSDPGQLQAADWLEGYKQYVADLREARVATDQEDAAAVARAQARWDAYQDHVLKAQLDRLGEGGRLSDAYWASEKTALEKHLAAVKASASDETAYKIYEAGQWDAYNKVLLEQQAKSAGTFADTLAAKWSLAFGGYESETTRAQKRWDAMATGIVDATNGMVDGVSGGLGDIVRMAGNGAVEIEDIATSLKGRLLDAFADMIERMSKMWLEDFIGGFSGAGSGGGFSLSGLFTGSSASSGGSAAFDPALFGSLGDSIGKSTGDSLVDSLRSAGGGTSLFIGDAPDIGKSIGKEVSKSYSDVWDASSAFWEKGGADAWKNGSFASATAAGSKYNWGSAVVGAGVAVGGAAQMMSSTNTLGTIGGGIMTAGGIMMMIPGGQVAGAITAAVGGLVSLFGQENKREIQKTASGYNVGYAGGHAYASGVDFYSDGSVVGTGASDPAVTKAISDAFRDAAEQISDAADTLGFAVDDLLDGFVMPSMNLTDGQLDTYKAAGSNMLAFKALDQAGLRGAFDALARDGDTYQQQITDFADSFSTVVGTLSAYGYEARDVAQITQGQIDDLRAQTVETASGTSQAILTMAASMGATSDQLALLAANASDGSQALAVTDEQLSNLLEADYARDLLDAVGGEDAFAQIMSNLTGNIFDTIDAYAENLDYYNDKAAESIAKLGDSSVTVENFWERFDAALKSGLSVDEFEAWAKASSWVANIDSVNDALADWNDGMTQLAQSLDVRLLKAGGLDYQADLTQRMADAEWELASAREAGYDAAMLARIQEVQAAELAAAVAKHQQDYADAVLDAQERIATATDDKLALLDIQRTRNQAEYRNYELEYTHAPGHDDSLFRALEQAYFLEESKALREIAETLAAATQSMERDLAVREARLAGDDALADGLEMLAEQQDALAQAYKDGLSEELIARLINTQSAETEQYLASISGGLLTLEQTVAQLKDALVDEITSLIDQGIEAYTTLSTQATDLASKYYNAAEGIFTALQNWAIDDSGKTADETFQASSALFGATYKRAMTGDADAFDRLASLGGSLRDAAQSYFADSEQYDAFYRDLQARLGEAALASDTLGDEQTDLAKLYDVQVNLYELLKEELSKDDPNTQLLETIGIVMGQVKTGIDAGTGYQQTILGITSNPLGDGGYSAIAKAISDSGDNTESLLDIIGEAQTAMLDMLSKYLDASREQYLEQTVSLRQAQYENSQAAELEIFKNSPIGTYLGYLAGVEVQSNQSTYDHDQAIVDTILGRYNNESTATTTWLDQMLNGTLSAPDFANWYYTRPGTYGAYHGTTDWADVYSYLKENITSIAGWRYDGIDDLFGNAIDESMAEQIQRTATALKAWKLAQQELENYQIHQTQVDAFASANGVATPASSTDTILTTLLEVVQALRAEVMEIRSVQTQASSKLIAQTTLLADLLGKIDQIGITVRQ